MNITPIDPPRVFVVGGDRPVQLKDCGRIELEADEQVTFVTESGAEYDVVRKAWGFYATPSLNRRLPSFGLLASLVKSRDGRCYIFLLERGKDAEFERYMESEGHRVICWLDSDAALERVETKLKS